MSGYADVHNVVIPLWSNNGGTSAITLGTTVVFPLRAPTAVNGGGLSILSAFACSNLAMAAGSSPLVRLLRYSSSGTPAVEGTIAAAVGGSGAAWAANVPQTFTISDAFVDAGEYVAVELAGTADGSGFRGGTANNQLYVNIQYAMGY